jgi:hypothetical protein
VSQRQAQLSELVGLLQVKGAVEAFNIARDVELGGKSFKTDFVEELMDPGASIGANGWCVMGGSHGLEAVQVMVWIR